MNRNEIRQVLVELLESDIGDNFSHLKEEHKLREELGLDSVDVVSVVAQIERRFRIRMTQEELQELVTVGDMLDLMQRKLMQSSQAA